jgi:hypothetical protein
LPQRDAGTSRYSMAFAQHNLLGFDIHVNDVMRLCRAERLDPYPTIAAPSASNLPEQ